jgi:hypothetical protein
MARESSSLVQRGMVLLALIGTLAVVVLFIMLRKPSAPEGGPKVRPELLASGLYVPQAGFPAALNWPALLQLADAMPSPPGWEIRYTATRVLAGQGSSKLPLANLCEMLDEDRQMRNFRARLVDGRLVPDAEAARQEVIVALKAVVQWHQHPEAVRSAAAADLEKLYAAVDKLTHSSNNVVRTRAQETQLAIGRK